MSEFEDIDSQNGLALHIDQFNHPKIINEPNRSKYNDDMQQSVFQMGGF